MTVFFLLLIKLLLFVNFWYKIGGNIFICVGHLMNSDLKLSFLPILLLRPHILQNEGEYIRGEKFHSKKNHKHSINLLIN